MVYGVQHSSRPEGLRRNLRIKESDAFLIEKEGDISCNFPQINSYELESTQTKSK